MASVSPSCPKDGSSIQRQQPTFERLINYKINIVQKRGTKEFRRFVSFLPFFQCILLEGGVLPNSVTHNWKHLLSVCFVLIRLFKCSIYSKSIQLMVLSIFGKEETEVQRVNPACARWAPGLVLNHHSLPPLPDYHVLSSLPLPFWSHLTRTLPSGSLHFCPHSLLDSAPLVAGQRRLLPTTSPSCHINKSPYLFIIQLFGSQIHAGGRFPNN